MKILASYNIKGGVGKTATVVNLAWLAASGGAKTLLWDLDAQGASSFYFRVKPKIKGGSARLLKKGADLSEQLKGTDFALLDILPADFSYRHMDIELDEAKKPWKKLLRLLERLGKEYDYIFLDCPPSVSVLSEAVFGVADALMVPLIPTTLSLRTYDQMLAIRRKGGFAKLRFMPFFSMVDRRKKLHLDFMRALPAERHELLETAIPYASEVERMGSRRAPLVSYSPKSAAAKAYRALWEEISARLEKP